MAIVTYSNPDFGFGVTYDDASIVHTDDTADPRLRAAWSMRIPTQIAAAVLFTTRDATIESIARGLAPSLLLTTDAFPMQPDRLGKWDWEAEAEQRGRRFLEVTVPPADAEPPAPVECLSMLHTPQQTFAIELAVPVSDLDQWSEPFQEVADGFFLLPIEREGFMRTGHQHAWSARIEAAEREDDLTDGLARR
jgi:hypothetical protein